MSGANSSKGLRMFFGVRGRNPHLKEMRKKDAEERKKNWESLSFVQQLETLNRKFPDGAKKQKAKIRMKMATEKSVGKD